MMRHGVRMGRAQAGANPQGSLARLRGGLSVFRRSAGKSSADATRRRGAMENDCDHRRRASHPGVVLARRKDSRDYNEASA